MAMIAMLPKVQVKSVLSLQIAASDGRCQDELPHREDCCPDHGKIGVQVMAGSGPGPLPCGAALSQLSTANMSMNPAGSSRVVAGAIFQLSPENKPFHRARVFRVTRTGFDERLSTTA